MTRLLRAGLMMLSSTACAAAPKAGVPLALAEQRAENISEIRYSLLFRIPESTSAPVQGQETLRFILKNSSSPLIIDFRPASAAAVTVKKGARDIPFQYVNEHIVIAASQLSPGENSLDISFAAGDGPLNRSAEFLYTLFVPARAREAFPCFDQPNLKARYDLTLDIPASWKAVANGAELSRSESAGRAKLHFAATKPISTYLFAFAAGKFKIETARRDGRDFRFFHRETDAAKIKRNRDAIFDLTAQSLRELENYTGMPYAFGKFDFALIPSFQYGGMEHPGAVFYNASTLFLDESATSDERLKRAHLIAHEIAHMWFGNLVTMRWFNDVWLKEVFANFMADQSVNPLFPAVSHELRFLLGHYPAAYEIDRTAGTHPVVQNLENLNEAGTLYGPIIYDKAPVVMKHLERMIGAKAFREGLRDYLEAYRFGNAAWDDLIAIFERRAGRDLGSWSRMWVKEPGYPKVSLSWSLDKEGRIRSLRVSQTDTSGRGRLWDQKLEPVLFYSTGAKAFSVDLAGSSSLIKEAAGLPAPDFILHDRSGLAYGLLELDKTSRRYLLNNAQSLADPLLRAVAWLSLWDSLLERRTSPRDFLSAASAALSNESDELNVQNLLRSMQKIYWRFLPAEERRLAAPGIEARLWELIGKTEGLSLKSAYFKAFRAVALTPAGVKKLEKIWRNELNIPGLELSENDMISLALELALRDTPASPQILAQQRRRIENPDRKKRFSFLIPAVSGSREERAAFFAGLKDMKNRQREEWVEAALKCLHHPLRTKDSLPLITPSLELLEEIQKTGDIFFPKAWVANTLEGHASRQAARHVKLFLRRHHKYPPRLRRIILQSAHELFITAKFNILTP